MTQPGCTKMVISQLLLAIASSDLVGRKSKRYWIIKFSLLLSIRLCWREMRPDAGKTTEIWVCCKFSHRSGFGQNSFALMDRHVCLVAVSLTNSLSLKIFMISGLNFQTVQLTNLSLRNEEAKHKILLYDFARQAI